MGRGERYKPEQVVLILRKVEAAVGGGAPVEQACRDAGIVRATYYR
jgi:hypothetical protein